MKNTVVVYSYEYYDSSMGRWFTSDTKKTTLAIELINPSRILIESGERVPKSKIDESGNYVP